MQTRLVLLLLALTPLVLAKKFKEEEKPAWAKKDIRDYSEADLERLLDQWEVGNNTAIGKRHIGPNSPDSHLARE